MSKIPDGVIAEVNKICDEINAPHVTKLRQGVLEDEHSCALANTFYALPNVESVSVDNQFIHLRFDDPEHGLVAKKIALVEELRNFIVDFDNECYPELIEDEDEDEPF